MSIKKTIPSALSASKRYQSLVAAVHMVYRLVNATHTVEELSLRLTRLLCQFVRASSASVLLLDSTKKRFEMKASFDNQINTLTMKRQIKNLDPQLIMVAKGKALRQAHLLALPLVADDYLGVLLVCRESSENPFDDFDVQLLSVFAEQTVTAIRNLQLLKAQESITAGAISVMASLVNQLPVGKHTPAYVQVVRLLCRRLRESQEGTKLLVAASVLHDVGLIDIPSKVLGKKGKLTFDEFATVQSHIAKTISILSPFTQLRPLLPIIRHHHERYDGTGYPSRLSAEQIPFGSRVLAVVDAFEAMVQERPWRHAYSVDESLAMLRQQAGKQFDPKIVQAFLMLAQQKKFRNLLIALK